MKHITLTIILFLCFQTSFADSQLISAYDSKNNTISINAKNISFIELMKRIGLQTGIQFYADLSIDKVTSYQTTNAALEKTIKQLTRNLSTAITYTEKKHNSKTTFIISSIRVLPKGESNSENAVALSSIESSALAYAHFSKEEDVPTSNDEDSFNTDNYDHMQTRWLARISKLPLDERAHIESIIQRHKENKEAFTAHHQTNMNNAKLNREKHQQQTEQHEKTLEEKYPERYLLRQQRLEEIQESIKADTKN